jgi:hypothetical protein
MIERLWPNQRPAQSVPLGGRSSDPLELFEAIERLSPQNDLQRSIKAAAVGIVTDIGQTRWLMFEQESLSISKPLLVILVFWLTINFFSFGLFAPRNGTVIATLCLCAIAVAGAIFLILELYRPFGGFIQIPSTTLTNALAQLGH